MGSKDSELYCICQKPYKDGEFMIECGKCNGWFHGSCVGIEEYQADDIDIYVCPKCQPEHGPLVYSFLDVKCENGELLQDGVKRRRNVTRHNYREIHEGTKQITAGTVVFVRQLKARKFLEPTEDVLTVFEDGTELTAEYLHNNNFDRPIIVKEKTGLGIKVPPSNFTIYDVEKRVGSMYDLHVIDVSRQEDLRMKMREWTEYYNSPVRGKVLNVISLEFSKTSLSELVMAPDLVRNISWVDNVWPKEKNEESPHTKPIVSKYCLMSVKDCYTDFHVDFGGSSVWYHIIRGEKIFYCIKPTDENLEKYSRWVSSSDQSQVFFGDKVDKCYKVCLSQGNTLLLPTGWIHAVLTPKDSLVFGGNFLHTYNIPLQLKCYDIEKSLHTPLKFLFPNFETTNWYAARSILKKVKEIHQAGYQLPPFIYRGVEAMLVSLRKWICKKDEYVKYHKLQIPLELNPQKLIKSLEKELKMDAKINKPFTTDTLTSPAAYGSALNKNVIRLKFNNRSSPRNATGGDSSSGVSSPEKTEHAKGLERLRKKREKLKKREKKLKEELENKRSLPSIKLNLNSDGSFVKKEEDDDSDDENDGIIDVTKVTDKDPSGKSNSGIRLKLSISQPPKKSEDSSDVVKSESETSTTSATRIERPTQPVARLYKSPMELQAEIEAAKKDIFSPSTVENKNLYFAPKEESDTVKSVTISQGLNRPLNMKSELLSETTTSQEEEEEIEEQDDEDDEGGYVIDFLPKPKGKPDRRKKRNQSESDSDYDPSDEEDNYYEDANFVYPRIDVDSELIGDDFSWNPSNRKAPKRKRKHSKLSKKLDDDAFFAPDDEIKRVPKPEQRSAIRSSSSDTQGGLGPNKQQPIKKKIKTSTAKQRLGKLLKLDKTGSRYMR